MKVMMNLPKRGMFKREICSEPEQARAQIPYWNACDHQGSEEETLESVKDLLPMEPEKFVQDLESL